MYVKDQNCFAKYFVLGFKVQNLTALVDVANINIKLVKPVSFSWHLSRVDIYCRETFHHHGCSQVCYQRDILVFVFDYFRKRIERI